MKPVNNQQLKNRSRGLSLVEVLSTVAILGILAAIAIEQIGNFADSAKETTAKRNAQNLARISTALASIGVGHVIPESLGGKEATCRVIKKGVRVQEGIMAGQYYGMPSLGDEAIPPATAYLEIGFASYALQLNYYPDEYDEEAAEAAAKAAEDAAKAAEEAAEDAAKAAKAAKEAAAVAAADVAKAAEDVAKELEDVAEDAAKAAAEAAEDGAANLDELEAAAEAAAKAAEEAAKAAEEAAVAAEAAEEAAK